MFASLVGRDKEDMAHKLMSSLTEEVEDFKEANEKIGATSGGAPEGDGAGGPQDVEAGQQSQEGGNDAHVPAHPLLVADGSGTRSGVEVEAKPAADGAQVVERTSSNGSSTGYSSPADGGASATRGARRAGGASVLGSFLMRKQLNNERERLVKQAREERDKLMSEEAKARAANMRDRLSTLGLLDDITMFNLNRTFAPGQPSRDEAHTSPSRGRRDLS